jgi:transposase
MDGKDHYLSELQAEIQKLRDENQRLRDEIQRLQEEITRLKKDSGTSSKPPSSDVVKPIRVLRRLGSKRRRGGQLGHRKCSRPPFTPKQVDQVISYELSTEQAKGLEPLNAWFVVQQVELPKKMFHVIEHRARKYRDPATGRIVIAPMPATIRKGGLAGPKLTALMAFLKSGCHCSFSTIRRYCREVLGLTLSRGMLSKVIQKAAKALKQPYEHLQSRLPHEAYLGADETGHQNNGKLHWTWCFQTPQYSLFHIDHSRGSKVLRKLLGKRFGGILNCDYYSSYRKYARLGGVRVQYCLAHLIREIRFLTEHPMKKLARWGRILLQQMKKLFKTLHNQADAPPERRFARLKRIEDIFLHWVRQPPDHKLARKLARRFRDEGRAAHYFRFVASPEVPPTNNGTERAIRHVVIDRKVTQGTRGDAGMRWCERSWTAIATCRKQNRNVLSYFHQALRAHWSNRPAPALC